MTQCLHIHIHIHIYYICFLCVYIYIYIYYIYYVHVIWSSIPGWQSLQWLFLDALWMTTTTPLVKGGILSFDDHVIGPETPSRKHSNHDV